MRVCPKEACEAGFRRAVRVFRAAAAACLLILVALPARAARIGLDPLMGDGSAGRTVVLSGVSFEPSTPYTILIGGFNVIPFSVTSNASGVIAATTLTLPDLPRGNLEVMLASATLTRSFTGAFRVWPNTCLTPIIGEGRFGETYQTNAAISVGGWVGMVLQVEGWGFAAGVTIPTSSITVGGVATTHPAIAVSAGGRFPSTTLVVSSNLPNGFKDLVVNDGSPQVFAGVYQVRRSIGMTPARGYGAVNSTIYIEGWGFVPGNTGAITIGAATVTPNTLAVAADGSFAGTIRLQGDPGGGSVAVNTGQESFPGCYDDTKANQRQAGIVPVTPTGLPNQAIRIQGTGNWTSGQSIAANSSLVLVPGADVPTVHPAIPIAGGRFAPTWIVATQGIELNAEGAAVVDPVAGVTKIGGFYSRRIISECPIVSGGLAGFTTTVSGWGFDDGAGAISAITVGGAAATYPATAVTKSGDFGPTPVAVPALPNGDADVVITDSAATTFARGIHVRRTIGLSFVVGPGVAGDATSLNGYGFAPGTIGANTATFGGIGVSHAAITVAPNGGFPASPLTLPLLNAGPYDIVAQAGEAFLQAYRVYNPVVAVSKYRTPGYANIGSTVTFSISYTNIQWMGEPRATGLVLADTLPLRTQYVAGSTTSALPATPEWYHPSCSCWNGAETPVTDVSAVRWTLSSPLPVGASGYVGFQVLLQ